jgi:eukaryotic-like serine/threonine-protein kinase
VNFFRFLINKSFYINLLAALLVFVVLFWGVLRLLDIYTLHGDTVTVPDLRGYELNEVSEIIEQRGLRFIIVDSVYDPKTKAGAVVDQEPKPEFQAKENRMIYLTVNAFGPPQVKIPELVDLSLRQAVAILESAGLKVGTLKYVPDIAQNVVVAQEFKGKKVEAGVLIAKGSAIDLVLGMVSDEMVLVPNLINMTLEEAITALYASSLNPGSIVKDETVRDSIQARVYRQMPAPNEGNFINLGSSVDLFMTQSSDKLNEK